MDENSVRAAEIAVAVALKTEQRVEIVKLKDEIKVNIVKRKEVKIPT